MSNKNSAHGSYRVLLPEHTDVHVNGQRQTRRCNWPSAQASGLVEITRAQLHENLVWDAAIDAHGVSSPWSAALAFHYRLNAGLSDADELLRLLLLARYVGALKDTDRKISKNGSALEKVLFSSLPRTGASTERAFRTLEWAIDAPRLAHIVGASIAPDWYLFPTATYQSSKGLEEIKSVLLDGAKSGLHAAVIEDPNSGKLELGNDELRGHFYNAVQGLSLHPERVSGPWPARLQAIAQRPDGSFPQDLPGVFLTCYLGTAWRCSAHEASGPWGQDRTLSDAVIDKTQQTLFCTRHHEKILVDGKPVPLEALGATVHYPESREIELLVWTDTARDPNISNATESPDGFLLQFCQGPRIEVRGRKLSLNDITCKSRRVPALSVAGPADQADNTIPVKCEYLDLIEGQPKWLKGTREWEIKFRGRPTPDRIKAKDSTECGAESGIVVWPREHMQGWDLELVGAYFQLMEKACVVYRGGDGRLRATPFNPMPIIESVSDGAAEYVSLIDNDHKECGAVWVGRKAVSRQPGASQRGLIAIDFGTSNTTVKHKIAGEHEDDGSLGSHYVLNGTVNSNDRCMMPVAATTDFPRPLIRTQRIFSEWYQVEHPIPLISTLLWDKRDAGERVLMSSVMPRDPGVVASLARNSDEKIHDNLKWRGLVGYDRAALQTYLRRVLAPAFHALARRGVDSVKVAASYPLAFGPDRKHEFRESLQSVMDELSRASGLQTGSGALFLYSESLAGTNAVAGENARYKITIDMGGGTTDIAIMGPDLQNPHGDSKFLAADSLNIGARKLMGALRATKSTEAFNEYLSKALNSAIGESPAAAREIPKASMNLVFESLLQDKYIKHLESKLAAEIPATSKLAVAALLAGIAVAADRLLGVVLADETTSNPKVQVAFLGQGWHLLKSQMLCKDFSEGQFLRTLAKMGEGRYELVPLSAAGAGRDEALTRKLQVVNGAMKLLENDTPADVVETVSYVGMDLSCRNGSLVRSLKLGAAQVTNFADGDPGFRPLIDELIEVAKQMPIERANFEPQIGSWLDDQRPEDGQTRMSALIGAACASLNDLMIRESNSGTAERRLKRSPLVDFLSGPWPIAWGVPADE
jgi:hypothetical protein